MFLFFYSSNKTNIALEATLQNKFHLKEMQEGIDLMILGKGQNNDDVVSGNLPSDFFSRADYLHGQIIKLQNFRDGRNLTDHLVYI